VVSDPARLADQAAADKPLVVIVEIGALAERVCAAVRSLRAAGGTAHIPTVAFVKAAPRKEAAQALEQAQAAGARLVVGENALLPHLPQLLEQALSVD
jgi:CheY-like chemotaxis protein